VKNDAVKNALQAIQKDAKSQRLQEESRRIFDKNFSHPSR
jgi:hypothetical protein